MRPITICLLLLFTGAHSLYAQLPPKREFRAVWIATINNIDWPTRSGGSPDEQREQFRVMLDHLKRSGINAIFVQVRPAADAFYLSSLEPWSEWLTGEQGKAPEPFYDPLSFMVEEAHARHMEFHAWLNPYRAVANRFRDKISPRHITNLQPQWFLNFGQLKIFNPGVPDAREYIVKVVADIASRYDIDGIHFDDYFYPYPSNEYKVEDAATYRQYGQGFQSKSDWRRFNVDMLIKNVHDALQRVNPKVKFGVSPYSVWRNSNLSAYGSETNSGLTSYDHLYADVRNWLQQGWIDYVVPQLYYSTKHKGKPYKKLVDWWAQNVFNRHLYIGHATYRLFADKQSWPWHTKQELPTQVRYLRGFREALGSAFYGSKALLQNKGSFRDSLQQEFYRYPALMPTMAWKDPVPPNTPKSGSIKAQPLGNLIEWEQEEKATDGELAHRYVIYRFNEEEAVSVKDPRKIIAILSAGNQYFLDRFASNGSNSIYAITALDRMHNESIPLILGKDDVSEEATEPAVATAEALPKHGKHPKKGLISSQYSVTYEQASYFYQLALKNSKQYTIGSD